MRTETVVRTLYQYSELSDEAKEKAREWYRDDGGDSFQWVAQDIIENAARMGELMGLNLNQRPVTLVSGKTRYDPAVYFDLGRGGGTSFEATYRYRKGAVKAIKAETNDVELIRIATELQKAQRKQFYKLYAVCSTSHRHSSLVVEVEHTDDRYRDVSDAAEDIKEALSDFAHWIYKNLCRVEEWVYSDEYAEEAIINNDYEFTEDGEAA